MLLLVWWDSRWIFEAENPPLQSFYTSNMRLPNSMGEKATKATKKKPLEAVNIFGGAGAVLEDLCITESGSEIQCYVQVSPGDIITLGYEIPCTEGRIVDIFIDGVLRETNITTNRPVSVHRGKISKVCTCDIRPSGPKGKLEYCDTVVEDREITRVTFSIHYTLLSTEKFGGILLN
jgi:hypothetical protein